MQLILSDILDVGTIASISIFFLNIIVSGFEKKREGGPSSLSKRLSVVAAASVASARHGRLIQGHRLRTGLPVMTETVAEKRIKGEGFCACRCERICTCSGERTCSGADVGVLGDGRGVLILPALPALPLDEVVVGEDVYRLRVSCCEVFSRFRTCLRCVVDSPSCEEYTNKGGSAKSGCEADSGCGHSLSGTMATVSVAVIAHASHFLAVESEVPRGKIINSFHNKRNLHHGQY